jgi:3-oxoacyl-[acyl-carrier-protein] synthase-3
MDGFGVLSFFNDLVPKEVVSTLRRNKLVVTDVDYFIFHQASGIALDTLQRVLKIPDYKMARYLEDTGNLVSASLPVAIKRSIDECNIKPGNLVMLCGFGVGLSWGTALMRVPEVTD